MSAIVSELDEEHTNGFEVYSESCDVLEVYSESCDVLEEATYLNLDNLTNLRG